MSGEQEDSSGDGLTSVSSAPLVMDHIPMSISHLTDTSQNDSVMGAVDGVLSVGVNDPTIMQGSEEDDGDRDEPVVKRIKFETGNDELNHDQSIKNLLFSINKAICMRLDGIENSIEILSGRTKYLEEKMDELIGYVKQNGISGSPSPSVQHSSSSIPVVQSNSAPKGAVIVGLPQGGASRMDQSVQSGMGGVDGIQNMGLGPNVTLITLNSEEDFPTGTWLGDETNPEIRVRTPITPSDLLHIHSNCRTAEKMALTLLDYLFDRETQASSNLSGMGKYGKKQLDPLMIYGIRCHLIHRFNISEADWHRIKQNIDSKCRTAFRRKQKGMPLTVKAFRGKSNPTYVQMNPDQDSDEDSMQDSALHIQHADELKSTMAAMSGDGIHPGEIQILHATPEQISQLQHAHHIQILQGDQVIQVPVPLAAAHVENPLGVAVSLPQPDSIQVATLTTDTGEVLQIQQADPS